MNQPMTCSPIPPVRTEGIHVVPHPHDSRFSPGALPYRGSGNSAMSILWGTILIGLGLTGIVFGVCLGSGIVVGKGVILTICGFVRLCS